MKKTLIATTIALTSAFAVPAQADVNVSGWLDVTLNMGDRAVDVGGTDAKYMDNNDDGTFTDVYRYFGLGFTGSEDIGNGMKTGFSAYYSKYPTAGNSMSNFGDDGGPQIWLSGGFGKISVGKLDTAARTVFNSTASWTGTSYTGNRIEWSPRSDVGSDGGLRNKQEGINFAPKMAGPVAIAIEMGPTVAGVVSTPTAAAEKEGTFGHMGLRASYANGPITAGLGYTTTANSGDENDTTNMVLAGKFKTKMFAVGLAYGTNDNGADANNELTTTFLQGDYYMGANTLRLALGTNSRDMEAADAAYDKSVTALQFARKLGKPVSAYFTYYTEVETSKTGGVETETTDTGMNVGLAYSF